MMKELKFALYAIKKNFQSSAELRTSFVMNIVGMTLNNSAFVIIWMFFVQSVGVIGGWTAVDIIGLQGFSALSFGVVMSIGIGIRKLPDYVAQGVFDRFMLSPKNILVRVATSSLNVSALGDIAFGVICLVAYAVLIHATLYQIGLMVLLSIIATVAFLGVIIAIFSLSFFFTDASAVTNSLFELVLTPALFHGGIFQGATRFIFTFIIPALLIGAIPVEVVRSVDVGKLVLISALALFWLVFSVWLFNRAVRKYESTNFMTFGS